MPPETPPDIYEMTLAVPADQAWRVVETLEDAAPAPGAVGLIEREGGDWQVWAHYTTAPDRDALARVVGEAVGAPLAPERLRIERLPQIDWVARSQAMLPPVAAGRFIVHGSHDRARLAARAVAVEIEAGRAFGSAHHGSTRGCLLALDALLKRRTFANVLDVGTGSGLLAIAMARAQRRLVLASDIDPVAVATARANARQNGVAGLVEVVCAAGLDHGAIRARAPFDLILANILARPLVALAPALARIAKRGGNVVLSGLTLDQVRAVAGAYRMSGFVLERRIVLGTWATLILSRR